jgi:hypothetical protein
MAAVGKAGGGAVQIDEAGQVVVAILVGKLHRAPNGIADQIDAVAAIIAEAGDAILGIGDAAQEVVAVIGKGDLMAVMILVKEFRTAAIEAEALAGLLEDHDVVGPIDGIVAEVEQGGVQPGWFVISPGSCCCQRKRWRRSRWSRGGWHCRRRRRGRRRCRR